MFFSRIYSCTRVTWFVGNPMGGINSYVNKNIILYKPIDVESFSRLFNWFFFLFCPQKTFWAMCQTW